VQTMLFEMPLGRPHPSGPTASLFAGILAVILLIGCGLLPGPLLNWLGAPTSKQWSDLTTPPGSTENH
jgi:hypothetical protein